MKFTNSQKHFINDSIRRELRENDRFIKWLTDTAEKENAPMKVHRGASQGLLVPCYVSI